MAPQGLESQTLNASKIRRKHEMKYNYSKLLGRIRERGFTQEQLAGEIDKDKSTLSAKLNGKFAFTTNEIDDICRVLDIPNNEIGEYFFAR
jgi:transcriptional regulator with XRE-family HTH domain